MLKNACRSLAGILVLSMLSSAPAGAFDEGIDYKTLAQPQPTETAEQVEVLELFWYGCPHCYHLEPQVERWVASQPDHVRFRRLPAVLGNHWAIGAKAYYAAETLGVLDRVHQPLFEALHKQKRRLDDEASLADFFAEQGVDRDEFLKALRSFIVDVKVRRAIQYGQRVGLDGVPAFVVDGKYLTSPSLTGSSERMFRLLDELVAREAGVAPAGEGTGSDTGSTQPPEGAPQAPAAAGGAAG
jgi:thiol:disulfide interchange protein DsbA